MPFNRAFRLSELLLPGEQQMPASMLPQLQPVFDLLAPRVGECLLSSWETSMVAAAGNNTLNGPSPGIGRIHVLKTVAVYTDTTIVGPCTIQFALAPDSSSPADRWGQFTPAGSTKYVGTIIPTSVGGTRAAITANTPEAFMGFPPIVPRGNYFSAIFTGCAGGETLKMHLTYFDCPGELVPL